MRPFEEVVRDHGAVVMRVCRALLPPADAEDAWSETFLSALQAYPRLRPGSNERGWLVTIAHRRALDQLRAAGRRAVPAGELPDVAATASEPPDDDGRLRTALDALGDKQRQAVLLHHVAGLSYREVAAQIGGTEAAARGGGGARGGPPRARGGGGGGARTGG
ncbi:MAG: sigma-70 family RNA polymerase sigma factor, partial [Ilumatobacteraceae bacterium]